MVKKAALVASNVFSWTTQDSGENTSGARSDEIVYIFEHVGGNICYHFYCYLYTDITLWHVNPII